MVRSSRRWEIMYRGRKAEAKPRVFFAACLAALWLGAFLNIEPVLACSPRVIKAVEPEVSSCASGGGLFRLVQWRRHKAQIDAQRFSAQIKKHLGWRYSTRRRQFRSHQVKLEGRRRAFRGNKARTKAHQFAAARRRAAQHSPRRGKPHALSQGRHGAAANDSGVRRWRMLWRHRARHDDRNGEQQSSD
jgi:hypothetical protein